MTPILRTLFLRVIRSTLSNAVEEITITPIHSQIFPFHLCVGKVIETKHTFIHYVEIDQLISLLGNTISYFNAINATLHLQPSAKSQITFEKLLEKLTTTCPFPHSRIQKKTKQH